jgi:hypothetical protein
MWLCLTSGLFSATCPVDRKTHARVEDRIQIRARLRKHLPALLNDHKAVFEGEDKTITEDAGTDYRFRIIVSRQCFAKLMMAVAMSNNNTNFKDAVAARWGHSDPYNAMLHKVWSLHYNMQEVERRNESTARLPADALKRGRGRG